MPDPVYVIAQALVDKTEVERVVKAAEEGADKARELTSRSARFRSDRLPWR